MNGIPPTCTARPATSSDLDGIAELLQQLFDVRHTVASLRWKLTGCAGKMIGATVLTDERRIVGFLGQIPVRIRVMGREVPAAQGTDIGILEEYRRIDAFLGLIQVSVQNMRAEGVDLTYGTANADSGPLATQLLGLTRIAPIPLLVRPLSPTATSLPYAARILARLLSAADRRRKREPSALRDRFRLDRITRFDERFDRFWERVRDDYPVMLVRDAAHLNWRYADAPHVAYTKLGLTDTSTGQIQGYAVLGLRQRAGQLRGHIADLVTTRKGHPALIGLLIRAAVDWLRAQAAEVAEVWAFPHTPLRHALISRGFIPRRTGPGGFQISHLEPGGDTNTAEATRAPNWLLAMGDSDTV
jgi:hypothetical protein